MRARLASRACGSSAAATARSRPRSLWLQLRLGDDDAASLAGELKDLLRRYEARSREGGRRYIVHAAVAPA